MQEPNIVPNVWLHVISLGSLYELFLDIYRVVLVYSHHPWQRHLVYATLCMERHNPSLERHVSLLVDELEGLLVAFQTVETSLERFLGFRVDLIPKVHEAEIEPAVEAFAHSLRDRNQGGPQDLFLLEGASDMTAIGGRIQRLVVVIVVVVVIIIQSFSFEIIDGILRGVLSKK